METTIKKRFTIDQIEELFDSKLINIRFFEVQEKINYDDPNQKFNYLIKIRHQEKTSIDEIINKGLKYVNTLIHSKKYLSYKGVKIPKKPKEVIELAYQLEKK